MLVPKTRKLFGQTGMGADVEGTPLGWDRQANLVRNGETYRVLTGPAAGFALRSPGILG